MQAEEGHRGSLNISHSHCRKQEREQEQITELPDASKECAYIGVHESDKHSAQ